MAFKDSCFLKLTNDDVALLLCEKYMNETDDEEDKAYWFAAVSD